jgi:hypothetical protein
MINQCVSLSLLQGFYGGSLVFISMNGSSTAGITQYVLLIPDGIGKQSF